MLWIQCNIMKLYLRVQRIAWPSLVGSLVCLLAYIACIEMLRASYGESFYVIAIANTAAFFTELAFGWDDSVRVRRAQNKEVPS